MEVPTCYYRYTKVQLFTVLSISIQQRPLFLLFLLTFQVWSILWGDMQSKIPEALH
ncbi:hypothetical protein RintRC_5742 [Richelia intracellularis]|nr:hypothetical protein RintRC_2400 [Richelia intracellularis]CDN17009.1 hypothetical protein RintRC_5742 [Richelia intracellularis]